LGYEADWDGGWLGGAAFRYGAKKMDAPGRASNADIDSFSAALYGGKEFPLRSGTVRLLLAGQYGRYSIETERWAVIGATSQHLRSDYGADSFLGSLEAAYAWPHGSRFVLEPFASAGFHYLKIDGFKESGGNAALFGDGKRWSHALSAVGLRAAVKVGENIDLNAEAAWRHIFGSEDPKTDLSFLSGSRKFTAAGLGLDRNEAILGLSLGARLSNRIKLSAGYNGALGRSIKSHAGSVTLSTSW
jgi:outer membrane autotransporter protein